VISYTYDGLYRLNAAAYSTGECYQFAYDKVGNRTTQTATITSTLVTAYQYDAANRLSSVGSITYTWDNNGNLLNDGSALYRYDQANHLISTTLGSTTSLLNYNGDGVRLKQTLNGVVTTYTQDLAASLPVVLQAKTGITSTHYLYALETRPFAQITSNGAEYLLPDGLGSVRQIASVSGHIIVTQDYAPYGDVLNSSGSGQSAYGFTGEEQDQSGLIFLRARYMQPKLGIFLSRDPWRGNVLRPGSMNRWSYGLGNPVNYIDPSGESAQLLSYLSGCNLGKRNCTELAEEIARTIAELSQRGSELINNPLNLPRTGPKMTVESHRRQFETVQTHLRKLISEWNRSGCGGNPPGDAWRWATMAAPWPRPKLPGSTFGLASQPIQIMGTGLPEPTIRSSDIATGKTLGVQTQLGPTTASGAISNASGWGLNYNQAMQTAEQITFWGIVTYLLYNSKGCLLGPMGCIADWLSPVP
jgi:RHS repeat-associated protein